MLSRRVAAVVILLLTSLGHAQTAPPTFLAADVQPSPHRSYPFFYAVLSQRERYIARDATLLDLISLSYSIDRDQVQAGPPWLDFERFDIIASVPPQTSAVQTKTMLRTLLEQRFGLATHFGKKPMPAYILTAPAGAEKLAEPASPGDPICDYKDPGHGTGPSYNYVECRNITFDEFAARLRPIAGSYLANPVVNATHIEGPHNFEFHWTSQNNLQKQGADAISFFDAMSKQLGLKLTIETSPRDVLVVDKANPPTPNSPDIATALPPEPLPAFEVATIKPSKPDTRGSGRITGSGVNFTGIPLQILIDLAWDLNESDPQVLVNAPPWLNTEKFDISAKVAPESTGHAATPGNLTMDIYEVQQMVRALLIERFSIKAHMETRPITAYTLVVANPKLKPADPNTRTSCKEGPGPDGKDPRTTNPILNRLMTCQNITIAQMCEEFRHLANGYIYAPVEDQTGLKGGYDFTLSFSSADRVLPGASRPAPSPSASPTTESTDPNGAVSFIDAVNRQLGLKLEKRRRPLPVLVLDHVEQVPTAN
jgi:uncharacterized protein (TIGR03435 family)